MWDRYYEPDWVAANPEIQDLWHRLIHSPKQKLYAFHNGIFYCINKGIGGSERRMLFTCSREQSLLDGPEADWMFASDHLSEIAEQAKQQRGLDLIAIFAGVTE